MLQGQEVTQPAAKPTEPGPVQIRNSPMSVRKNAPGNCAYPGLSRTKSTGIQTGRPFQQRNSGVNAARPCAIRGSIRPYVRPAGLRPREVQRTNRSGRPKKGSCGGPDVIIQRAAGAINTGNRLAREDGSTRASDWRASAATPASAPAAYSVRSLHSICFFVKSFFFRPGKPPRDEILYFLF